MLRIRQEQWDRFAADSAERFEQSLIQTLKRSRPTEANQLGAEGLKTAVSAGITQATERGISSADDIASFLTLGVRMDPTFQTFAEVEDLLLQEHRSWTERLAEAHHKLDQSRGN